MNQVLLVSTLRNVQRMIWRLFIPVLGFERVVKSKAVFFCFDLV